MLELIDARASFRAAVIFSEVICTSTPLIIAETYDTRTTLDHKMLVDLRVHQSLAGPICHAESHVHEMSCSGFCVTHQSRELWTYT